MRTFVILLLLLPLAGIAQRLKITPLSAGAFVFTTYNQVGQATFPSNGMYLVGPSGVVIIDSPWDTTQFQPLLDSIEARHHKPVLMCIATHFHDDRTAAFDYFRKKGIATWASARTKELCITRGEKQPEFVFVNDTSFAVGGVHFETFYPGPGHAPDNIVIWVNGENILFGGCLVKSTESRDLGNIADASLEANGWEASVKKVLNRYPAPNIVVPGHFSWNDKRALLHTLRLLRNANK